MGQDVYKVLMDTEVYKSPRPDKLQALFFQKQSRIVGIFVTNLCLRILNNYKSTTDLNKTLIILILKVENPENVTQLIPISLCNVIFKLFTKTIVSRLRSILPSIISPTQSNFVPNRSITDNIVVVQELLHIMRCKTRSKA